MKLCLFLLNVLGTHTKQPTTQKNCSDWIFLLLLFSCCMFCLFVRCSRESFFFYCYCSYFIYFLLPLNILIIIFFCVAIVLLLLLLVAFCVLFGSCSWGKMCNKKPKYIWCFNIIHKLLYYSIYIFHCISIFLTFQLVLSLSPSFTIFFLFVCWIILMFIVVVERSRWKKIPFCTKHINIHRYICTIAIFFFDYFT